MAEIEAGPEANALVAEKVMGIDPRATTPADIGRAVMWGMVSNFPRDGYDVMCFNWGTPSTVELTYSGSYFNYGEADGNDGYGLYFWEHREGQPWQPFIEAYVAKWRKPPRPYSTDIAAAWAAVEKMRQAGGWNFAIEFESHLQLWRAWLWREGRVSSQGVTAETAPLAICKAVLKAVGYSPVERETAAN